LQQGSFLANNELGNADFYANTIGGTGKDMAERTQQAGDARAAGIMGSSQAITGGINGAANALTQGLTLYGGGQRTSSYGNSGGLGISNKALNNSLDDYFQKSRY
jgi:hypothetical protein